MNENVPTLENNSHISNHVFEKSQIRLSLRAKKTLYGLIQSVDPTGELFGEEMSFDIRAFFKMLNIEDDNNRWEVVRDCFIEIAKSPMMDISKDSRHGLIIHWVSKLQWDGDKNIVKLKFTEDIKPYLHQMKGYIKLKGRFISHLDSNYAMDIYPLMKVVQGKYKGVKMFTLEEMMICTNTLDKKKNKSYHSLNHGTAHFIRKVIGIKKNKTTKRYDVLQPYIEKTSGNKITPPLAEINIKTDVHVDCQPVKDGQKIIGFTFVVKASTPLADKIAVAEKMDVGIDLSGLHDVAVEHGFENAEEYAVSLGYHVHNGKAFKFEDQLELNLPSNDPLDNWKNSPIPAFDHVQMDEWRRKVIVEFMPQEVFWKLCELFQIKVNDSKILDKDLAKESGKFFGVRTKEEVSENKSDLWKWHLSDKSSVHKSTI
jgi:plasmid replication initiation protein